MKSVDIGVLSHSVCFSFTPSDLARDMFFYLTWCGHYYCTRSYYMKRDYYDPLLLVYVEKGVFHVEYRGEKKEVKAGEAFFIDCREPHYYHAEDNLEFYYIHIDGSNSHEICQYIMNTQGWHITKPVTRKIYDIIKEVLDIYQSNHEPTPPEISFYIYQIFHLLMKPSDLELHELEPVEKTIHYIRSNVGKTITLDELADYVSLSASYLSHIFKKQTGFSPLEYVINTRIERAKSLLITSNLSVEEIAYQVGYSSSGSLINLFMKKLKTSPKHYRISHRSADL